MLEKLRKLVGLATETVVLYQAELNSAKRYPADLTAATRPDAEYLENLIPQLAKFDRTVDNLRKLERSVVELEDAYVANHGKPTPVTETLNFNIWRDRQNKKCTDCEALASDRRLFYEAIERLPSEATELRHPVEIIHQCQCAKYLKRVLTEINTLLDVSIGSNDTFGADAAKTLPPAQIPSQPSRSQSPPAAYHPAQRETASHIRYVNGPILQNVTLDAGEYRQTVSSDGSRSFMGNMSEKELWETLQQIKQEHGSGRLPPLNKPRGHGIQFSNIIAGNDVTLCILAVDSVPFVKAFTHVGLNVNQMIARIPDLKPLEWVTTYLSKTPWDSYELVGLLANSVGDIVVKGGGTMIIWSRGPIILGKVEAEDGSTLCVLQTTSKDAQKILHWVPSNQSAGKLTGFDCWAIRRKDLGVDKDS